MQDTVREGLAQDVKLGVIESPAEQTSQMVFTPKHDRIPRRTVDYKKVNTHCQRQTHHTPMLWQLACSIPGGIYMSVLDNWNEYHSLALEGKQDKNLMSFITPWGRFQYLVVPMGLECSGYGFTDKIDCLYQETPWMKRIMDDSLLYDKTIVAQLYQVC